MPRPVSEAVRERPEPAVTGVTAGSAAAKAHITVGWTLESVERTAVKTAADCNAALAINPQRANTHSSLGATLCDKGDVDGAIASFRAALAIDPQHAMSREVLGLLVGETQRVQGATATQGEVAAGAKTGY